MAQIQSLGQELPYAMCTATGEKSMEAAAETVWSSMEDTVRGGVMDSHHLQLRSALSDASTYMN